MLYLFLLVSSIGFAIVFTIIVKYAAIKFCIVDKPTIERKIHTQTIPLLGGIAIFAAFFLMLYCARDALLAGNLEPRHWLGFFVGACFLIIGGALDDKYNLKPKYQIIFPLLAIACVLAGGVSIDKITNPFGGLSYLNQLRIPIGQWRGVIHYFSIIADSFVVLWLLGMMYTTKLLDGVDGLVTGITAIGGFIIFIFTITTKYYQPDIGLAALILTGVCLGFLIFNWNPAKIFLGESGSLFLGYALGVLAIISGGKIAIALLVMGLPVLDLGWTIIRRLKMRKNPFSFSDRLHLHHRFMALGLSQKQTVLIYYLLAACFGLSALFLQSMGKFFALLILVLIMIIVLSGLNWLGK